MGAWFRRLGSAIGRSWRYLDSTAQPFVTALERSPLVQLIAIGGAVFGFVVVVMTAIQIQSDLVEDQEERASRTDDAIERRWNQLLRRAAGNTGKGGALTFLYRQGERFDGIDLSCAAIGEYSASDSTCQRPPILAGVRLGISPAPSDGGAISEVSFRDVTLYDLVVRNEMLLDIDLRGAWLQRADLGNVHLEGRFSEATLVDVRIIQSTIASPAGDRPAAFFGDVSGSAISFLEELGPDASIVAWADFPPFVVTNDEVRERPASDDFLEKMTLCAPPSDEYGRVIPLQDRTINAHHYVGRNEDGSVSHGELIDCTRVRLADAKATYPDAYQFRQ